MLSIPPSSPVSLHPGRQLQVVTAHPHLITVYDFEQEGSEELDTVILKALVKGEHGEGGTGTAREWGLWGQQHAGL